MRFAVTGAAGFIGSHLSERLLADGHVVRGIDCFTDYYPRATKEENLAGCHRSRRFEMLEVDVSADDLDAALAGCDGVFHLAAQPGVRTSWHDFETYVRHNVLATQRLMEAVRRHRMPVVYASSSSVYGEARQLPVAEDHPTRPVSPYGVTKLAAEQIVSAYGGAHGLPVASVRYFTVYGPRQRPDMAFTRFLSAALSGIAVEILGDGEQSRDFTYVGDAVDATVRAMGRPDGHIHNVGGGTRATVNEIVAMIGVLTGKEVPVRRRPRATGDVTHTWADTVSARRRLGWSPRTSLREGLEAQLRWLAASPAARVHVRSASGVSC